MEIKNDLKKKSVISKLNKMNVVRCCHTSLLMIIVTVFFMLVNVLFIEDHTILKEYGRPMIGICVLSVAFMISTLLIRRNKKIRYRIATDLYVFGTEAILIFMASQNLRKEHSMNFYFGTIVFMTLVPVFVGIELYLILLIQIALMMSFLAIYGSDKSILLPIIICNVVAIVVNYHKYKDICGYISMQEQLYGEKKESEHDPLTGLLNRRGMEKKVNAMYPLCQRHRIPVGVIMLDIDEFKKYNDTFGHPEGDVCIQKVSNVLKETAKRDTDIIARVGGEEFLVFVQEMRKEDLILLASRIQQNVEAMELEHAKNATYPYVTISIGLAHVNSNQGIDFHNLYEKADQSLYFSKKNGRDCISMNQKVVYRNNMPPNKIIAK